jgi:hypothetical protein
VIQILQRVAIFGALASVSSFALAAQPAPDLAEAQRHFDEQVAYCNSGQLPRPQRDACIRDAGRALDQARGGPATGRTTRTADRRATVVKPEGSPVPSGGSKTIKSSDRRSTIVVPTDGSTPER